MHEKYSQSGSSGSPTAAYKGPPPSGAWFWAQHSIGAGLAAHAQLSFQVIVDVKYDDRKPRKQLEGHGKCHTARGHRALRGSLPALRSVGLVPCRCVAWRDAPPVRACHLDL